MCIRNFSKIIIVITILIYSSFGMAWDKPLEAITDQAGSVQEVVDFIETDLENQGFKIALILDHSANAASVGLELRPTQIILARPPHRLEKKLLKRSESLGLDLPMKFLVFEDDQGDIQLRYNPVGYLFDRHDLLTRDRTLSTTEFLTEQFGVLDNGILNVESLFDRDSTVQNLRDIISGVPNFGIPLVLDYGKKANCTLIVFGNPLVGTPLMQATQEVALDLPQKFLVCENSNYKSTILYNDPLFIGKRHNVQGQDMRLNAVANALRNFATMAAGQ